MLAHPRGNGAAAVSRFCTSKKEENSERLLLSLPWTFRGLRGCFICYGWWHTTYSTGKTTMQMDLPVPRPTVVGQEDRQGPVNTSLLFDLFWTKNPNDEIGVSSAGTEELGRPMTEFHRRPLLFTPIHLSLPWWTMHGPCYWDRNAGEPMQSISIYLGQG
jgi:hypothetical protein